MKLLLTGKNGQLGFELQRSLASLGQVFAVDHADCDFINPDAVRALIRTIQPDVIINPAAYTAVDKAETDSANAFAINAVAPQVIGEEASAIGACVIHYSTDYVFNGEASGFYSEEDITAPQNVYGCSKLAGENALQSSCINSLILRTSWIVGSHGNNFAKTILKLASERNSLNVVSDQFGSPTSAILLADITAHLVQQMHQKGGHVFPFGLYHLTAAGETSWYEYACFLVAEAMKVGKSLALAPDNIRPVTTEAYPTVARRPKNSRLDTRKLRDTFNITLPSWQDGVRQVLRQLFNG